MKKDWNEFKKEKQSAIFDSAIKVIREKGFHRMRMVDIAKEAGISYGLVYHYFKNKESLINDILNQWWEELYRFLETVHKENSEFHEKLKKIILYFLDLYQQKPDLMNIFITQISRSSANLTKTRLDHFKIFISLTEGILTEGQKRGFLRRDFEAPYLTYIFLGALETFITIMVMGNREIRDNRHKERITQSILEVFLNGARNRG
jgi:TetR/AcrR family transcriptional regulator, fatty acid metabolism regulator protein